MEVFSIFTSNKNIIKQFDTFIYNYKKFEFEAKDVDTAFFNDPTSKDHVLYYHYILNNIEEEFSYNYTEEDQSIIKHFFGENKFYNFDIQYSNYHILHEYLISFIKYLKDKNIKYYDEILFIHPFKGLFIFQKGEINELNALL